MVIRAEQIPSPNHSSRGGAKPRMIILHYTAGGGSAVDWFRNPASRASAHFVVRRDGTVVQMVDLDRSAWHAGQKGIMGYLIKPNRSSVGIEIVNWGELTETSSGSAAWTGLRVPEDDVAEIEGKLWQRYTERQEKAIAYLVKVLCDELGIPRRFMFDGQPGFVRLDKKYDKVPYYLPSGARGTNSRLAIWRFKGNGGVCGHCHIARTKDDPGPHLDWAKVLG